jgi:quercetin dioxygenase-like cupin family protein
MNVVPPFDSIRDGRGEIRDLIRDEKLNAVTLVRTKQGAVRGNHVHRQTAQWIYMLEGRVRWVSRGADDRLQELVVGPGELVVSPPNEPHAMVAEEDASFLVFTRGPRSGDHYEEDTQRLEEPLLP